MIIISPITFLKFCFTSYIMIISIASKCSTDWKWNVYSVWTYVKMIIISHSNQPYLWDKQSLIVSSLFLVLLLCACILWNADVWELPNNDGKYFLLGSDVFILHAYCTWYGQHHLHFLNVRSHFSNNPFKR